MKNLIKFSGIIALVAIIGVSFTACGGGDDGGGGGGPGKIDYTANGVDALVVWLKNQQTNTSASPYAIKLKAIDLTEFGPLVETLTSEACFDKYVYLDLSECIVTKIPNEAFHDNYGGCVTLTGITIPKSVASIGEKAFSNCTSLSSVTIPNGVASIGYRAFHKCTSLVSVTIPNSVISIGNMAFAYCDSLTSVTIPNSVTSIENLTFAYCTSLTSVTIGSGVTSIGYNAFEDCDSLTSVTFQGTITADNLGNSWGSPFSGDLREKYLAGGVGTYTRPNGESETWTKK